MSTKEKKASQRLQPTIELRIHSRFLKAEPCFSPATRLICIGAMLILQNFKHWRCWRTR